MISDLKLLRIGYFSFFAPTFLIVLPDFVVSNSKLRVIPFSLPESVEGILMLLGICSALLPLVFGFWLIGRWLNPENNRGAELLAIGILNLLTLPWLFIVWVMVGLMSFNATLRTF